MEIYSETDVGKKVLGFKIRYETDLLEIEFIRVNVGGVNVDWIHNN